MISIGMPGIIDETQLTCRGDKLILTLPPQHADLDGERLRRRFESLATVLGRTGEIRIAR
jgi:exopolyphosphatase/guanosine-5'-triphosphate,3'-diphosphate pyrophosphatase